MCNGEINEVAFPSLTNAYKNILALNSYGHLGPTPIISYDNFWFYFIIIDEYTRLAWFFSLSNISNMAYILLTFIKFLHNYFPKYVKEIQSFGGGEFVNHELTQFLCN